MIFRILTDFFPFCHNSRVWQTDRRTDTFLVASSRWHSTQRRKKTVPV